MRMVFLWWEWLRAQQYFWQAVIFVGITIIGIAANWSATSFVGILMIVAGVSAIHSLENGEQ